jgi:serine/threonine-protein kinase
VDIYDVVLEHDQVFLVMELLSGEPMSSFLTGGRHQLHEVIALLLPVMRGAAAAHAVGIVHRDIKPDNILLARDSDTGEIIPTLIDFGISRMLDAEEPRLTHSGTTMGTPRYVSFEQLCGRRDVDHRADVYAFGVIVYEAIVGRPPYDASSFGEQAMNFVSSVPPAPRNVRPQVPALLNDVVSRAIEKDRDQRPASMNELIDGLAPFATLAAYPDGALQAIAPRINSVPTADCDASSTTLHQGIGVPERLGSGEQRPASVAGRTFHFPVSRRLAAARAVFGLTLLLAGALGARSLGQPKTSDVRGVTKKEARVMSGGLAASAAPIAAAPSFSVPPIAAPTNVPSDLSAARVSLDTQEGSRATRSVPGGLVVRGARRSAPAARNAETARIAPTAYRDAATEPLRPDGLNSGGEMRETPSLRAGAMKRNEF